MSSVPRGPRTATTARAFAAAAATLALVLAAPLAASAHVHVDPGRATAGAESTELAFAVPTESAKAVTSEVQVHLPTSAPFAFATVQQLAGWKATVTTAKLSRPVEVGGARITEAPVAVTWTAQPGTQLTDGEFQHFTIAVGPMPDVGRLLLPVTQRYSDGTVVHWNQRTPGGGGEPEHPAPVLYVKDTPPQDVAGEPTVTPAASTSDTLGIALGGGALAVALAALVLALAAVLRGRRPAR